MRKEIDISVTQNYSFVLLVSISSFTQNNVRMETQTELLPTDLHSRYNLL